MTVAELMLRLREFPKDLPVVISDGSGDWSAVEIVGTSRLWEAGNGFYLGGYTARGTDVLYLGGIDG